MKVGLGNFRRFSSTLKSEPSKNWLGIEREVRPAMNEATSMPCAMRWPKMVPLAYSASTCTLLKSPVSAAKAATSASVMVRDEVL
ncbi:hypothetical protein D9M68_360520 [compost metagenome]